MEGTMKKRDEWMFDGDCNKCVLFKCCVLQCKAHKDREAKKAVKERGAKDVKREQKAR